MLRTISFHSRTAACVAAVLLIAGCDNVPKYKKSSGRFNEWASYQGGDFSPAAGVVSAVDPAAQTITITQGDKPQVFAVTSETRIMHEGEDITLAELPLNQAIKFTLAADHQHLLTVWYGTHSYQVGRAGGVSRPK